MNDKLRDGDGEPINQVQNKRGEWVPSIPEPLWVGRGLKTAQCECGAKFKRVKGNIAEAYRGHYALVHILGLS